MAEAQDYLCADCQAPFPVQQLTFDHVIPIARGGANSEANLQLLCYRCNQRKGDRLPARSDVGSRA
jgi:5-methylcytosine-specific restriction protein A